MEYTCTFNSNDGSTVKEQKVCEGGKFYKPSNPKKEGYKFIGWYTDEKLTEVYDFDETVTKNITLYAKWEANQDGSKGGCGSELGGISIITAFACIAVVGVVIFKKKKFER